jgi:tetratricopeptide (TPR) repeat protein
MNPRYREMILGKDLTPVSKLSGAFLSPPSGLHLQFAYYESSLVVQFLVERFGLPKLRAILADLHDGVFINTAIERHTTSLDVFEKDFAAYAREKALALGPGLSWDQPPRNRREGAAGVPPAAVEAANDPPRVETGTNYWRLLARAGEWVEARRWPEARAPLEDLIRHYPEQTGGDSAHALLARVNRELGDTGAERSGLERWAAVDAEATDAYLRLMELAEATADWSVVVTNAERYLAVNPLVPAPYRFLARAWETEGRIAEAIDDYRTLLRLDPHNPADVHFQLARLMESSDPASARKHLLESLGDAPRNREALRLLLRLEHGSPAKPH